MARQEQDHRGDVLGASDPRDRLDVIEQLREVSLRLKTKASGRSVKMFEPVKVALFEVMALNHFRSRFIFCGPMGRGFFR